VLRHWLVTALALFYLAWAQTPCPPLGLEGESTTGFPAVVLTDPAASDMAQWVAGVLKGRDHARLVGQTLKPDPRASRRLKLRDGSLLWLTTGVFQPNNGLGARGWPWNGVKSAL
jgi:C-terminal processing protease CtpA/Prc